jgi:hypothetical protein
LRPLDLILAVELRRGPDAFEGAVEAEARIDIARKIIGRRHDRLKRGAHERVAMSLAARQGARIAAQEGQVRRKFLAERH